MRTCKILQTLDPIRIRFRKEASTPKLKNRGVLVVFLLRSELQNPQKSTAKQIKKVSYSESIKLGNWELIIHHIKTLYGSNLRNRMRRTIFLPWDWLKTTIDKLRRHYFLLTDFGGSPHFKIALRPEQSLTFVSSVTKTFLFLVRTEVAIVRQGGKNLQFLSRQNNYFVSLCW